MESSKRDPFIDMLKGIGILLVIWGHSSLFLFHEIYSFHMPLFFFLSGCFFKTNVSTFCFVKKKFIQLLIPYGIFFFLSCLYYILILGISHRLNIESLNMIKGVFPINNQNINEPLWFLYALFWMSIIYYIIRKYFNSNIIILIICILLHLIEYFCKIKNIELPLYIGRSLREVVYMHLGYWSYNAFIPHRMLLSKVYITKIRNFLLGLGIFILLYAGTKYFNGVVSSLYEILIAISGISFSMHTVSLLTFKTVPIVNKTLSYLGTHTLCLFALHLPLFEIARPCAYILWKTKGLAFDSTVFMISLLLSIICGEVLMVIFPKYLGRSILNYHAKITT